MSASPQSTPYMHVSALEAGHLSLPLYKFIQDEPKDVMLDAPSLAFLLQHSVTGEQVLFDLGINKKYSGNWKVRVQQDVKDSLMKGGLRAEDVKTIILSHVHFDHVGDPALFPNATFVLSDNCQPSLISKVNIPTDRIRFIPSTSFDKPISVFQRSHDYFNDGSLYVVDAPGHCKGHINLLIRTSPSSWLLLAGDSAHHSDILSGKRQTAVFLDDEGREHCMHDDKDAAEAHISRLRSFITAEPNSSLIIAHDVEWYSNNKDGHAFWPGRM